MNLYASNLSFDIINFILIILTLTFSASIYFLLQKKNRRGQSSSLVNRMVADTSALIDGRILEVVQTGFITGQLFVPKFMLNELQNIADSSDSLRRNKGRRGFQVLKKLQDCKYLSVEIAEADYPDVTEVDEKLVLFAKEYSAKILTVDFNLNEVAKIQKINVLNINELSNAIKPAFLPGEKVEVKVIQPGKERDQGVGYLEDGTMVVIENGREHIGQQVMIAVTSVIQKSAGRMVFGRFDGGK